MLVGLESLGGAPVDPVGAAAVAFASFCWALGSVLQRVAPQSPTVLLNVGGQMLAGGAMLLAFGQVVGERVDLAAVSARSWGALAYLTVFGALVATRPTSGCWA